MRVRQKLIRSPDKSRQKQNRGCFLSSFAIEIRLQALSTSRTVIHGAPSIPALKFSIFGTGYLQYLFSLWRSTDDKHRKRAIFLVLSWEPSAMIMPKVTGMVSFHPGLTQANAQRETQATYKTEQVIEASEPPVTARTRKLMPEKLKLVKPY